MLSAPFFCANYSTGNKLAAAIIIATAVITATAIVTAATAAAE